jgi:hypothetical protein
VVARTRPGTRRGSRVTVSLHASRDEALAALERIARFGGADTCRHEVVALHEEVVDRGTDGKDLETALRRGSFK